MLDSSWKSFTSKVKITFDELTSYEGLGTDDIIQVDIKEELANNNIDPLGIVSANTISIKLIDRDNKFLKTNAGSPYYGKIKEGIKIEYFISIDGGAYNNCGVYYLTDINNSQSIGNYNTVTISGADIIQYLSNIPVNILGIKQNQTVKQYYESIFASVGLDISMYNVASTLNKIIKYTYSFGETFSVLLNSLSKSYRANVFVDRDGIIQVVDLDYLASLITRNFEFDGILNTFDISLGTNLLGTYNSVKITYCNPTIIKSEEIISISNLELAIGTSESSEYNYNDNKRALNIDNMYIVNNSDSTLLTIDDFEATQKSIKFVLTNNDDTNNKNADIHVFGGSLKENTSVLEKSVAGVDNEKKKYLEIKANLIQTESYAIEYVNKMLSYLSSDISYIDLKTKGNPLLRLADIVGVKSSWFGINTTGIISSIKLSMGSSYSCNISVLNSSALQ